MSATLEAARMERILEAMPCGRIARQGVPGGYSRDRRRQVTLINGLSGEQAAEAFSTFVQSGVEGDVLVFMPGGFEISQTIDAIRHCQRVHGFILLPLHGELPPNEQDAAVARYEKRKVVVATNVAETSLTIDGVRCVIDSGLARYPPR